MEKDEKSGLEEIMEAFVSIGTPKEVTLSIFDELTFNSDKYAGNQDEIDLLLQDKLGIDLYIAFTQYKKI